MTRDEQAPPRSVIAARPRAFIIDRQPSRAARNRTLALFAGVVWLQGCAAQGPPHPPRLQRPEAVTDLAVTQVGRSLDLRFTAPSAAVDGENLTRPLEIEILRSVSASSAAGAPAPTGAVPPAAAPIATAPFATLGPAEIARLTAAGKVEYREDLSAADFIRSLGERFSFQVRGLTRGFRGRPVVADVSNTAALTLLDVPQAPAQLSVAASQDALRLRWAAPLKTVTGRPAGFVTAYRVYRSTSAKPLSFRFLDLAHQTSYDDSKFEFGHFYAYQVRAVVTEGGQRAESEDSATVSITPRDTFPPAAPAGVTGLYTNGAVELLWSPNAEPDLAGYNIYRREAGGGARKLNGTLLRSPLYRDSDVAPGNTYTYRVTAVDRSGNESRLSAETAVEVP